MLKLPGMSQSEWIAVAVIAGFVIYLAAKQKLGTYWSLLVGGGTPAAPKAPPAAGAAPGAAGSSTGSSSPSSSGGNIMPWWMPGLTPAPGIIPPIRF